MTWSRLAGYLHSIEVPARGEHFVPRGWPMSIWRFRIWVLSAGLVALSAVAQGRAMGSQIQIVVSVFNRAGVDQASILEAEKVAAKIYRQPGITIDWQNCRTRTRPELEPCKQTAERGELVLNVERQLRAMTADAYGVAFIGDDGWGAFCDIFYDRILELHHDGHASEATILGTVMAHELGHLLLGPDAHSAIGIMRPQLHFRDFLTPEFATGFSRSQMEKIRERWAQVTSTRRAKAMITTGAD